MTRSLAVVAAIVQLYSARGGPCAHPKWSMPTQTLEGSGTMTIQTSGGKLGNVSVPPTNSSVQEKVFQAFDYETLNMVMRMDMNETGSASFQMSSDAILNWKAGLMTQRSMINYENKEIKPLNMCHTIKLPFVLRMLPIANIVQKLKEMSMGFYKCVGNSNGLDNFEFAMNFPPKFVPKFIADKAPAVNFKMVAEVDADGLMKSSTFAEDVKVEIKVPINGKTEKMMQSTQVTQDLTYPKSRLGGPSEEDLKVPAEWGNCSTIHTPDVDDLLAEWEKSDSPFWGRTRMIPHMLRAMLAEAEAASTVVV